MKALVYMGPQYAEVKDVEEPILKEGYVKLKIKYCGICGSDIGIYGGTHPRAKAPLILGHEFIGTLCEDGKKFKKGDRVAVFPLMSCGHCLACRTGKSHICKSFGILGTDGPGGIAEYCLVKEESLFLIPKETSDKAATVIEPLAVIVRAIHQSGYKALDSVVVVGAGPIGMLTGMMLMKLNASKVYISDINNERLEKAKEFGMIPVNSLNDNLEEVVMKGTDGEGVDVLFECSGSETASKQMSKLVRGAGTICMVAVHKAQHLVDLRDINFKEQVIIGTRVYTKEEFRKAVDFTAQINNDLEKIVTHVVPLKDGAKVFDLIANPQSNTIKVIVDCE